MKIFSKNSRGKEKKAFKRSQMLPSQERITPESHASKSESILVKIAKENKSERS